MGAGPTDPTPSCLVAKVLCGNANLSRGYAKYCEKREKEEGRGTPHKVPVPSGSMMSCPDRPMSSNADAEYMSSLSCLTAALPPSLTALP